MNEEYKGLMLAQSLDQDQFRAARFAPTRKADPVQSETSQLQSMRCVQVPVSESVLPPRQSPNCERKRTWQASLRV